MPDSNYHIKKRDRFRDSATALTNMKRVYAYDPAVQDCFYAAMHEAERFLAQIKKHTKGHRRRENLITTFLIQPKGKITNSSKIKKRPKYPVDKLFDNRSKFNYMMLAELRLDLVYGQEILGKLRHATYKDVKRANILLNHFFQAITKHENSLRRKRLL